MDFPGALIPQLVDYLDGHTALAIEAVDKSHAFHVGKCRAELLKGSLIRTPGQWVPALHYNHMWCLLRLGDRGILPNWPVWLYSAVKFVSRPSLFKFLLIFDELCMSHSARDLLVPRLGHDQPVVFEMAFARIELTCLWSHRAVGEYQYAHFLKRGTFRAFTHERYKGEMKFVLAFDRPWVKYLRRRCFVCERASSLRLDLRCPVDDSFWLSIDYFDIERECFLPLSSKICKLVSRQRPVPLMLAVSVPAGVESCKSAFCGVLRC